MQINFRAVTAFLFFLIVLVGVGISAYLLGTRRSMLFPLYSLSVHNQPTLESVQALASLVTTRVEITDVQTTELQGFAGGVRAIMLVRGDFQIGTDLSRAKFVSLDSVARQAVLQLARPAVASPRVGLSRTRLVALNSRGLWILVPGDAANAAVTNLAYRDAQKLVAEASSDPSLIDKSQQQTERVLASIFATAGWTVNVQWTGSR